MTVERCCLKWPDAFRRMILAMCTCYGMSAVLARANGIGDFLKPWLNLDYLSFSSLPFFPLDEHKMFSYMSTKLRLFASLGLSFSAPILAYNAESMPQISALSGWNVISSLKVDSNASQLSLPGVDTSSWYTIGSHGTLMSSLLQNHVYDDNDLFFSTNLQQIDNAQFQVPWYYRSVISADVDGDLSKLYLLKTNGISSRAEIWANGQLVAG